MMDAKKFDPAAPVSRYLPQFHVKHDLSGDHRSLGAQSHVRVAELSAASVLDAVCALRLARLRADLCAGRALRVLQHGYQILGYVAERIDGGSFPSILERRVLEPLGMNATDPQMDDGVRQSLAISYERWPYDGSYVEANWFPYTAADGGIASTTADMGAYVRFMLNRGATPKGRILSPSAFEAFITPALEDYAYGVQASKAAGGQSLATAGPSTDSTATSKRTSTKALRSRS